MSNWMFVGAAFAATWIVLLAYLVHVERAVRRARALFARAHEGANR